MSTLLYFNFLKNWILILYISKGRHFRPVTRATFLARTWRVIVRYYYKSVLNKTGHELWFQYWSKVTVEHCKVNIIVRANISYSSAAVNRRSDLPQRDTFKIRFMHNLRRTVHVGQANPSSYAYDISSIYSHSAFPLG